MPLRRPVVPGTVAHFAVSGNPLFLLDFTNRDVTVATLFHGVCPMVASVLRPCRQIDVRADSLKTVINISQYPALSMVITAHRVPTRHTRVA
ncbi:MAG: hypothetical protein OXN16_12630 [Gammaproteobacteria bacterium]|nr:hypothetical protein [Gammaproteobacteria bacterium]